MDRSILRQISASLTPTDLANYRTETEVKSSEIARNADEAWPAVRLCAYNIYYQL